MPNAPVVGTNICVINAKGLTHRNLVFFVPVVKPQKPLPRLPNPQSPGHSQTELPTPVKVDKLSFFLSGYTPFIAEHLVSGFTLGFSIHHEGQQISSHSQNLMSALHNPDVVDLKIEKELLAGRLSGPFEMPPLSPFRVISILHVLLFCQAEPFCADLLILPLASSHRFILFASKKR